MENTARGALTRPLRLPCGVLLPHRLAKAALDERLGDEKHAPTVGLGFLYQRWADGGVALNISGNVMIDGRALVDPADVVLEDDRELESFRAVAALGTVNGAHLWMQLNHPGRQTVRYLSKEPVAPSAGPGPALPGGLFASSRALEEAEIEELVARFARSALLAKKAGYTGVQLQAAHGHLIGQFLSPATNRRTDRWGGTPENRRRFLLEVVRAVRSAVGPAFPIAVKLNSTDFLRGGFEADESVEVARALEVEGIDLLEISGGTCERPAMFGGPSAAPEAGSRHGEAYFLEFARRVRRWVTTPLMLTGGWRTAAGMSQAIEEGVVDLIGLARPLALEPDLPSKLLSGLADRSGVASHHTGHEELDVLAETAWYTHQLHLLARGEEPDPDFGLWQALILSGLETLGGFLFPHRWTAAPTAPSRRPGQRAA